MSKKTKIFVLITVVLGLMQIALTAVNWHVSDPRRFGMYLAMAVFCSVFQVKRPGLAIAFSLNLPFILISLVELSTPEAIVIGCAAALAQSLWDSQTRRRPSQILFTVTVLATIIGSAGFAYDSLIPRALQSATIRLFVVAAAFFVANTLPGAITLRFGRQDRLGEIWKKSYFWSFPYYMVAAAMAGVVHLGANAVSLDTALLALPVVYLAYRYYRVQKSQLEEKQKHAGDMAALHLRAIEGLALAVEAKDNMNTRGHLRRVQIYALELGRDLGLTGDQIEALHAAALLHDIGKLAVPEHILTKPGKLTPEEFAKMKVHPVVGAEIVEQVRFPYPVAPIVAAHHEKWDGTGYPYGLKGDAIPLGARILSAVDCLDALTSDREYRRAVPLEEAVQHIVSESGRAFDPKVVEVLERRRGDLEQLAKSTGPAGPVLSKNAVIRNGKAPAAGLDLCAVPENESDKSLDFLATIAAARRESRFLLDMAEGAGSSLDLNVSLDRVAESLKEMIAHNAMAFFVRRGNSLIAKYATGDNCAVLAYLEVPVGAGLAGWVADNLKPVINGNPAVDPDFDCEPGKPLRSALAVPLEGSQGLLGVIVLYHRETDGFTRDHLRMMLAIAPKLSQAVENSLKFRESEERANTDRLTDLPNAVLLSQSLDSELLRARRQNQPLAVMSCSVDGMRRIYSELGVAAGDAVLRAIAYELKQDCRKYDHLARVDDEEFALVLPGLRRDDVGAKVARLGEIAAQVHRLHKNVISFRLGQAFYPEDGDSSRHLLAVAKRRTSQHSPAAQPEPSAPPASPTSSRLSFKDRWPTSHDKLRATNSEPRTQNSELGTSNVQR